MTSSKRTPVITIAAGFICVVVAVVLVVAFLFASGGMPQNNLERICALAVLLFLACLPFGWLRRTLRGE